MNRIEPLQLAQLFQKPAAARAAAPEQRGFAQALEGAIASVNSAQIRAEDLARRFQENDPAVSLEQSMVALAQANVSFQALVQTRNRVVQAYQDIMNMQV